MTTTAVPRHIDAHGHSHAHAHSHGIEHAHEPTPNGGPVVLDIGGDIGALVVHLDEGLVGSELPIEYSADPQRDIHTGVWPRPLAGGTVVVAVFPELREGAYRIHPGQHHDAADVLITGGQICELDLRRHLVGQVRS